MTGIIGAFLEAWDELRVHRLRVSLSLIGIAVSVMAMASVTAAGQMLASVSEQMLGAGGKPATYEVLVAPKGSSAGGGATEAAGDEPIRKALNEFVERYQIEGAARSMSTSVSIAVDGQLTEISTEAVDPNWATVSGVSVGQGRWFGERDAEALSPPMVINPAMAKQLGRAAWTGPFTLKLHGSDPTTATVIGIYQENWPSDTPRAYQLYEDGDASSDAGVSSASSGQLKIWIDPLLAAELEARLQSELSTIGGKPHDVVAYRMDSSGGEEFMATFQLAVTGVGGLILALSGLNLLNIAMVTMRQRIREIGVRRALGASSARVFFAVLLESVVATTLAGLIGIIVSVIVMRNVPIESMFGDLPALTRPGYPMSAAIIGLVASLAVGTLCGLVPAVMAVKIRPIEAIRY